MKGENEHQVRVFLKRQTKQLFYHVVKALKINLVNATRPLTRKANKY